MKRVLNDFSKLFLSKNQCLSVFICGFKDLRNSLLGGDNVFGVFFVPLNDQLLRAFAHVLAVENGACEGARDVQAIIDGGVGAQGDVQVAFEVNGGREGA